MFAKRPKRGEGDDELIAFQEEFLKTGGGIPSAKVCRVNCPLLPTEESNLKDGKRKAKDAANDNNQRDRSGMVIEMDEEPPLNQVVEKDDLEFISPSESQQKTFTPCGFPLVQKLPKDVLSATAKSDVTAPSTRKKSLFLQQLEAKKSRAQISNNNVSPTGRQGYPSSTANLFHTEALREEVSKENEQKLSSMSHEEIIAEQLELAKLFEPGLLQMLKTRGSVRTGKGDPAVSTSSSNNSSGADIQRDVIEPIDSGDLPFVPDKKWLHMDTLEQDKLKWLKPIKVSEEKLSTDKKESSARFDFDGNVIDPEEDIDARTGLYHHGEEPARAGYTLEELYMLIRSSNLSQKILALSTIANVLRKSKSGTYSQLLKTCIIKPLLDADIVLLLRYALDEKADLVISAAVNAFHALLVNQIDQKNLDELRFSMYGHLTPELLPIDTDPPETEEEEAEREEEKYIDILKRDVIEGLMHMDFLPRLRYILEVVRPQKIVCCQILGILIRVAQRCSETAYKATLTPRLLDVIFSEFLPLTWSSQTSEGQGHGRPLAEALRFVCVLCSSGRNMAASLLAKRSLMNIVLTYTQIDSQSDSLPDLVEVITEAFLLWRTLILYGLTLDYYHSSHSMLLKKLQEEKTSSIRAAIVCLLTGFVSAAGSQTEKPKRVHFSETSTSEEYRYTLEWVHVAGVIDSVYGIMNHQLQQFNSCYASKTEILDFDLLISSTDFVWGFLIKARSQPLQVETAVSPMVIMRDFIQSVHSLLISTAFTKLLTEIRQSSILLCLTSFLSEETSATLPSLFSALKPSGDNQKPFSLRPSLFLHSLIRLSQALLLVEPTLVTPVLVTFFEHVQVKTYIRRITGEKIYSSLNYFSFVECNLLADLCILASNIEISNKQELHRLSLTLLPAFSNASLCYLEKILGSLVFNPALFWSHLIDSQDAKSQSLIELCLKSLTSIRNTYMSMVLPIGDEMLHSRALAERDVFQTKSLLVKFLAGSILPSDWPFLPVVMLYQKSHQLKVKNTLPPDVDFILKNSIKLIYLLERTNASLLQQLELNAKVARIMCFYLFDNDVFMEPDIECLLASLFQLYTSQLSQLDFTKKIPGLLSFQDFYASFIEQYESCSFGNNIFSHYLLLPAIQSQDPAFRSKLWMDHPVTLRSIQIKPQNLLLPMESFLYPEETNVAVVMAMVHHLLTETVTATRNTVLYIIAVHHANRFMFTSDGRDEQMKSKLIRVVKNCSNKPLSFHLTYYKAYQQQPETEEPDKYGGVMQGSSHPIGMIFYEALPKNRLKLLEESC